MASSKYPLLLLVIFVALVLGANQIREISAKNSPVIISSYFSRNRAEMFLQSLPNILDQLPQGKKIVLVFGASSVEAFVDTKSLESQLGADYLVLNLGIRAMTGEKLNYFARRIEYELMKKNRKVFLSIFKLESTNLTEAFSKARRGRIPSIDFISKISTINLLIEEFGNDFSNASWIVLEKIFFGSTTSEYILVPLLRRAALENLRDESIVTWAPWSESIFYNPKEWDFATRGQYILDYNDAAILRLKEVTVRKREENIKANMWSYFDIHTDIRNRNWNKILVDRFLLTLKLSQKFSEHVLVFNFKEGHSEYYLTSEGLKNMESIKQRIAKQGVAYLNVSEGMEFQDEDYFDMLHLSPLGQKKLNDQLTRRIQGL